MHCQGRTLKRFKCGIDGGSRMDGGDAALLRQDTPVFKEEKREATAQCGKISRGRGMGSAAGWIFAALAIAVSITPASSEDWFSTTLAGGESGLANGARLDARFKGPVALAVSKDKNRLFVCDTGNQMIRAVSLIDGSVSSIAGQGQTLGSLIDGNGTSAAFDSPSGIDVEPTQGLYVVVADAFNHRIRKVMLDPPYTVSTVAGASEFLDGSYRGGYRDGDGTVALLNSPRDVVFSSDGRSAFFVDTGNNRIRRVTFGQLDTSQDPPVQGPNVVETICGQPVPGLADGAGTVAQFNQPIALAMTPDGQFLLVADQWNHAVRRVKIEGGDVTTVAGGGAEDGGHADGVGTAAQFNLPHGITGIDTLGDRYMITDRNNHVVRLLTLSSGSVTTISGQVQKPGLLNGKGLSSKFSSPSGVAAIDSGTVAVADYWNQAIRLESTCIKASKVPNADFAGRIAPYNGEQCSGSCVAGFYPSETGTCLGCTNILPNSYYSGPGTLGNSSSCATACKAGFFDKRNETSQQIQCVQCSQALCGVGFYRGECTSGDGVCAPCTQRPPNSVYVGPGIPFDTDTCEWACAQGFVRAGSVCLDGNTWYVDHVAGSFTLVGNADGAGTGSLLDSPRGVSTVQSEGVVYIADMENNAVRRLTLATRQVDLVAGGFAAGFQDGAQSLGAKLNRPSGIAVHGNIIYVSEIGGLIIRKIDVASSDAVLSRFAGIVGVAGYKDGNRLDAMFNTPQGLAVSPAGDKLYVADSINNNVRQVDMATNLVSTLAGGDLLGGNTDGLGTIAKFLLPTGLSLHPGGHTLAVADRQNHRVRLINVTSGIVSTLTGVGVGGYANGGNSAAQFDGPTSIAYSGDGSTLFVADYFNTRVRQVFADTGYVVTIAKRGSAGEGMSGTIHLKGAFQVYGVAVVSDQTLIVTDGVQAVWSVQVCNNKNESRCGVGEWRGDCPVDFTSGAAASSVPSVACESCTGKPDHSSYTSPGGSSYGVSADTCEWRCDYPFYRRRDDLTQFTVNAPDGSAFTATAADPGGVTLTSAYGTSPDYQIDFLVMPVTIENDWRYLVFVKASDNECCQYRDRIPLIAFNPGETTLRVVVGTFDNGDQVCPGRSSVSLALDVWSSVRVTVEGDRASTVINGVLDSRCTIGPRFAHTGVSVVIGQRYARFEATSPLRALIRNLTYTHLTCSQCPTTPCPSGQYRTPCTGEFDGRCTACSPPPPGHFYTGPGVPFDSNNCTVQRCNTTACQVGEYQRPCSTFLNALCRQCVNPLAVFAYYSDVGSPVDGSCPWKCCCGYVADFSQGICVLPAMLNAKKTPAPGVATPAPVSSGRESFTIVYAVQYERGEFLALRYDFAAAYAAAAQVKISDIQLLSILERDGPPTEARGRRVVTRGGGKVMVGERLEARQQVMRLEAGKHSPNAVEKEGVSVGGSSRSIEGGEMIVEHARAGNGKRRQEEAPWLDVAVKVFGDAGDIDEIKARTTEEAVNAQLEERGLKVVYFQSVSGTKEEQPGAQGEQPDLGTTPASLDDGGGIDAAVIGGALGGTAGAVLAFVAIWMIVRRCSAMAPSGQGDADAKVVDDDVLLAIMTGDEEQKERKEDDQDRLPTLSDMFNVSVDEAANGASVDGADAAAAAAQERDWMSRLRAPGRTQSLPDEDMFVEFSLKESVFGHDDLDAAEPILVERRHSLFSFVPISLPTPPPTPRKYRPAAAKKPRTPRGEGPKGGEEEEEEDEQDEAEIILRMSTRSRAPPMNIFGGKGKRPRRGSLLEKVEDDQGNGQTMQPRTPRLRRMSTSLRVAGPPIADLAAKQAQPSMKKSIMGVGGQTAADLLVHANWTEILVPEEVRGGRMDASEKASVNFGWENGRIQKHLLRSTSRAALHDKVEAKKLKPGPSKSALKKLY